jgi:hypothetical protein
MSKADGEFMAVWAIPGSATFYRLDVTTTAATLSNLPEGYYVVALDGVTSVSIRSGGTAAEPASGSSGSGGVYQTGWTYRHPAAGNASIIVLGSGSGRCYLVPKS